MSSFPIGLYGQPIYPPDTTTPPSFSYPTLPALTVGVTMENVFPVVDGVISSYEDVGATKLADYGLSVSAVTGAIGGTPTLSGSPTFSVRGTGPTGSHTATGQVYISEAVGTPYHFLPGHFALGHFALAHFAGFNTTGAVLPPAPTISYDAAPELTIGDPMVPILPTVSGEITGYSDSGVLKLTSYGLTLNTTTGEIGGTPSQDGNPTFEVSATGPGGVGKAAVPVTIVTGVDPEPTLYYPPIPELHVGTAMSPAAPTQTAVTAYADVSAVPLSFYGLALDTATGVISGTPTAEALTGQSFLIAGTGPTGVANVTVTISIQPTGSYGSLRWDTLYPAIPQEVLDEIIDGKGTPQNDLSGSGQKTVTDLPTRANSVTIPGGTHTEPFVCGQDDTEYVLLGDAVFPGAGISADGRNNITIDLNGHTLTYADVGPDDPISGVVLDTFDNPPDPSLDPKDGWNQNTANFGFYPEVPFSFPHTDAALDSFMFTSGPESGEVYWASKIMPIYGGDGTTVYIYWHNKQVGHDRKWRNGGPQPGDTYISYMGADVFGVKVNQSTDVQIVNGNIVQGAALGSPNPYYAGTAWNPVQIYGSSQMRVAGCYLEYYASNVGGIGDSWTGGSANEYAYNTIKDNGWDIAQREYGTDAILSRNAHVHHNRMIGIRHRGIYLLHGGVAEYNEIQINSWATNSYGITSHGNVEARYNNIYGSGSMALPLGIWPKGDEAVDVCDGNLYHHNWVETKITREKMEEQYDGAGSIGSYDVTTCWSNRWDNRYPDGSSPVGNRCNNNTMIAWNEALSSSENERARITMPGVGAPFLEVFDFNVVASISIDDIRFAEGVCIGYNTENGAGFQTQDNTIISSSACVSWGYSYSRSAANFQPVRRNKLIRYGSMSGFQWYVDTKTPTGPVEGMAISNTPHGTDILVGAYYHWAAPVSNYFGYTLTVTVRDGGAPVEGASVWVSDTNARTWASGVTDANGEVQLESPTYLRTNPDGNDNPIDLTPLLVHAESGTKQGDVLVSPTDDVALDVPVVEA